MFSRWGSIRLPVPTTHRDPRGRAGRGVDDARLADRERAELRRLAGRRLGVGGRGRRGSIPSSAPAGARSSPCSARTRRAPTPPRPSSRRAIATSLEELADDPRVGGIVGYAETGDARFISTAGDAAYVVIELDMTDEESVAIVEDLREAIVPPAGYTYQMTGYGPITLDSAEQSEKDLLRAETVSLPDPALVLILVFASAVAAGMPLLVAGLAIPIEPGAHLRRRPAGRDEHLRPQHRDDARAGAGDRLLAVHRQPLPRGARAAGGRSPTPSSGPSPQPARPSRSAGSPSPSACRACSCSRRRRSGASASAGRSSCCAPSCTALTFLPAVLGMLGHRVNSLSLRRPVRVASGPWPPIRRPRRRGPRAGSASPTPSCAARSRSSSRRWRSCSSPAARSCASSRACRAPRSTRPASRAATPTSRSRPNSRRARPRPIVILADVTGEPTSAANIAAVTRASRAPSTTLDGIDRVEGPFTDPRPADRRAS